MTDTKKSEEVEGAKVILFVPRADRTASENLTEFVRLCREDLQAYGAELPWKEWKWPGVGMFTKQGAIKGGRTSKAAADQLLDPAFMDFAKAYVRHQHAKNPSEEDSYSTWRLQALRMLEASLLACKGEARIGAIDVVVLDQAASRARATFSKATAYNVGRNLEEIAQFVGDGLTPTSVATWRSGIRSPKSLGVVASKEGDAFRAKRLPNPEVLFTLAELFCSNLDPNRPDHQRDIYTTSITALLLSAPSRGGEVHLYPANLEFEETNSEGDLLLGLRHHAFKGFGHYIKWVWTGMAPVATVAIERVRACTEEARKLARWLEDPATKSLFYRHATCPNVPENQPLTVREAMQALGFAKSTSLKENKLSTADGVHTLGSLWKDWVLKKQPKGFPYIDKKKTLKYSDALFCMRKYQLHPNAGTSPVLLWAPGLESCYSKEIGLSSPTRLNIFDRHGYKGSDGSELRMNSHQLRHLLNTEAQRGGMSQEEIARWSGRRDKTQNRVYNGMPEGEKVERARNARALATQVASPASTARHWDVRLKPPPSSCADLDLAPRGANHITLYGHCEHDFLFSPCENFGECLNCKEHHCVKSAGKDDQERLARIKQVLEEVAKETEAAAAAMRDGDEGATRWHADQCKYLARLRELVSILESKDVSDGAVVRLRGANNQTHFHRVLRVIAMKALENNTAPKIVIDEMMQKLEEEPPGSQVYGIARIGLSTQSGASHGAQ